MLCGSLCKKEEFYVGVMSLQGIVGVVGELYVQDVVWVLTIVLYRCSVFNVVLSAAVTS